MDDRIYYEVGAYRIDREGNVDEGRDGILWIPSDASAWGVPPVAAVADGIGREGFGQEALTNFEYCYSVQRDLRKAVLNLLKEGHKSTFVGLQFPMSFKSDFGEVVSLGDSSAIQVKRNKQGQLVAQSLALPNTVLRELFERYPDLSDLIRRHGKGDQLSPAELDRIFAIVKPIVADCFLERTRLYLNASWDAYEQATDLSVKQFHVFRILRDISDIITLDLASSLEKVVRRDPGPQPFFLDPGDDVVLYTDGMNLRREQVIELLANHDPVVAAEKMVCLSDKPDDRAVVVVRAHQKPVSQSFSQSVRTSLRSSVARPGIQQ